MAIAEGLMSALTGAFEGSATSMKGDRLEGDQQIRDAEAETDYIKKVGIETNLEELNALRAFEGTQLLSMEKNFNQALREYGPEQLEELNTLALSRPELFQGEKNWTPQVIDEFLMSKTAPDIKPSGEIFVPTEGGTSQRLLGPDEGGNLYNEYLAQNKGMTGGDIFKSQYNEMTANVGQMLQQTLGANTANIFAGDYLKPGSKGEERFQTRAYKEQREATDTVTAPEFQQDLSAILTQKLFTKPDSITSGEMVRATNWTSLQDFNTIKNRYLQEYKGNELMAQNSTLSFMLQAGEAMDIRGMDRQSLVRSGVIPSGTIAHVLTTDPAGDIAVKRFAEAKRNPDNRAIFDAYQQLQSGSSSPENSQEIIERYNNLTGQIYNSARLEVNRTNYYTVAGEFLNAYTPETYPSHLKYTHTDIDTGETTPALFYPIASDGFVKLLDQDNPDPENPIDLWPVQYMIPEAAGGNPDREKNIYYNTGFGYDAETGRNTKLDAVFAEIKANDPFDMGLQITSRGAEFLEEFKEEREEQEVKEDSKLPDTITEENYISFAPPENYRSRRSIAGEYRPTTEYLEWATKNLDVWEKFLENLTAPIASDYPPAKPNTYINPEYSKAQGKYRVKLQYQKQLDELRALAGMKPYPGT
tara:strand:- start:5383 stop:7311 length:1929 start_codon:yes stop_codon:yes gene_type:complete